MQQLVPTTGHGHHAPRILQLLQTGLTLDDALMALQQLQDSNRVVAMPGGGYQRLY